MSAYEGRKSEDYAELQDHLNEKKASQKRLEYRRQLGKEKSSMLCASFDLQKVLNTPHGTKMLLF